MDDTDEKLQKLSEQITQLEIQTNTIGELQQNGEEKSSPNNREKITPDKLPEDLGLTEVSCVLLRYKIQEVSARMAKRRLYIVVG